jgi:Fe2+ transport system protein FeoA
MNSSQISIGISCEVHGFSDFELSQKLLIMGVLPGSKIKMLRKSPLGMTFYFKVDGNYLAMRKSEAEAIMVK